MDHCASCEVAISAEGLAWKQVQVSGPRPQPRGRTTWQRALGKDSRRCPPGQRPEREMHTEMRIPRSQPQACLGDGDGTREREVHTDARQRAEPGSAASSDSGLEEVSLVAGTVMSSSSLPLSLCTSSLGSSELTLPPCTRSTLVSLP